jgi:hypothetical protein
VVNSKLIEEVLFAGAEYMLGGLSREGFQVRFAGS